MQKLLLLVFLSMLLSLTLKVHSQAMVSSEQSVFYRQEATRIHKKIHDQFKNIPGHKHTTLIGGTITSSKDSIYMVDAIRQKDKIYIDFKVFPSKSQGFSIERYIFLIKPKEKSSLIFGYLMKRESWDQGIEELQQISDIKLVYEKFNYCLQNVDSLFFKK